MKIVFAALAFATLLAPLSARAEAEPSLIGSAEGWKAYKFVEKDQPTCFMSAAPTKQEGKPKQRGEVKFFVTRWPGKDQAAVSFAGGYMFKDQTPATLTIGDKKFPLSTENGWAWSADSDADGNIIDAMQGGATMTIAGTPHKGKDVTDTFSLKGAAEAYKLISTKCTADKKPAKKADEKKAEKKKDDVKAETPAAPEEKAPAKE